MRVLSGHLSKPTSEHYNAAKHVLRYLKTTMDMNITYKREGSFTLQGFSDSNWGTDKIDRRSINGYVFMLAGGPITWKSSKQHTVALSSTEAEYIGAAEAAKEAVWLRQLLSHLGEKLDQPTVILEDNTGTIALAKSPKHHNRTKHIDIRYHYLKQKVVQTKEIILTYCPTGDMIADMFTTALGRVQFSKLLRLMGLE